MQETIKSDMNFMCDQTATLKYLTNLNFYVEGIIRCLGAKECMPVVIYMGEEEVLDSSYPRNTFYFSREEAYKACVCVTEIDTYVGSRQWNAAYNNKIDSIIKKLINDEMLSTFETEDGRSFDTASYEEISLCDGAIELELIDPIGDVTYLYVNDIVKVNGLIVRFNRTNNDKK